MLKKKAALTAGLVVLLLLSGVAAAQSAADEERPTLTDRAIEIVMVEVPRLLLSPFYIRAPDTVQVGETFEVTVSSSNYDGSEYTYSNDPCYGSGVNTGSDPVVLSSDDVQLRSPWADSWTFEGGVVGYSYTQEYEAVSTGDVAFLYTISCLDGTTDNEEILVTIEEDQPPAGTIVVDFIDRTFAAASGLIP